MAFHQPTRQPVQRILRTDAEQPHRSPASACPASHENPVDLNQTWVLFSPGDVETHTENTSYLSSIPGSQKRTPGHSRISDLGSLQTLPHSTINSHQSNSVHWATGPETAEDLEEDAELDSLDSHLPDFRTFANPRDRNVLQGPAWAGPVFPAHDGLGSFRIDTPATNADAQEHMYAFEKYNPNRVRNGYPGLDLDQVERHTERMEEHERMQRIEIWRLEQSRLLLEAVQEETRRRLRPKPSARPHSQPVAAMDEDTTMENSSRAGMRDPKGDSGEWHEYDTAPLHDQEDEDEEESVWSRFTRKIIRDLIGIDDEMLSVLLGESLPAEATEPLTQKTPAGSTSDEQWSAFSGSESSSRHVHILERIAQELGVLVHQLSSHPGAFSAYFQAQQPPLPYAGLPAIPEANGEMSDELNFQADGVGGAFPQFQPTVKEPSQLRDFSVGHAEPRTEVSRDDPDESSFTQQEWEQNLDIKMVFKYLRSRFTNRPSTPGACGSPGTASPPHAQDNAAKAARVRQHHPLISRSRSTETRPFRVASSSSPVGLRRASSCASQSTKRSARRSSVSSRPSSRHYWDIGGSVGTGSLIASAGPMGSWGEV